MKIYQIKECKTFKALSKLFIFVIFFLMQNIITMGQNKVHFIKTNLKGDPNFIPWYIKNNGDMYGAINSSGYDKYKAKFVKLPRVAPYGDAYFAKREGNKLNFTEFRETQSLDFTLNRIYEDFSKKASDAYKDTIFNQNNRKYIGRTKIGNDIQVFNDCNSASCAASSSADQKGYDGSKLDEIIAFVNDEDVICTYSESKGLRSYPHLSDRGVNDLKVSPDGRTIIYTRYLKDKEVRSYKDFESVIVRDGKTMIIKNPQHGILRLRAIASDGSFVAGDIYHLTKYTDTKPVYIPVDEKSPDSLHLKNKYPESIYELPLDESSTLLEKKTVSVIIPSGQLTFDILTDISKLNLKPNINLEDLPFFGSLFKGNFIMSRNPVVRMILGDKTINHMTFLFPNIPLKQEYEKVKHELKDRPELYQAFESYFENPEQRHILLSVFYKFDVKRGDYEIIKYFFVAEPNTGSAEFTDNDPTNILIQALANSFNSFDERIKVLNYKKDLNDPNLKNMDDLYTIIRTPDLKREIELKQFAKHIKAEGADKLAKLKNINVTAVSPNGNHICGFGQDENNKVKGFFMDIVDYINKLDSLDHESAQASGSAMGLESQKMKRKRDDENKSSVNNGIEGSSTSGSITQPSQSQENQMPKNFEEDDKMDQDDSNDSVFEEKETKRARREDNTK